MNWRSSPVLFGIVAAVAVTLFFQLGSSFLLFPFRGDLGALEARLVLAGAYLMMMVWPVTALARHQLPSSTPFLRMAPVSFEIAFAAVIGTLALSQILQSYLLVQELFLIPPGLADTYRTLLRDSEEFYIRLLVWKDAGGLLLSLLAGALLPAVGEELLFRGLVQGNFERALRPALSILLAAFLFGALHLRPATFVPLLLLGAYLGFAARRSGSVYPAMLGHFTFNALAILGLYEHKLPVGGHGAPVHGMDDLIATLPATAIALVILGLALWRMDRLGQRGEEPHHSVD
jgi:membrane protease YdiL (CAAX protease family)